MTKEIKKLIAFILSFVMVFSSLLYFPIGAFGVNFGMSASATENSTYQPTSDDSLENPYQISNAEELYWFANYVNSGSTSANAILTNDIIVNENVLDESNNLNDGTFKQWTAIGNSSAKYTGTFDGQGHTISGLYNNDANSTYAGLFGIVDQGGIIENVGVIDSYFYGYSDYYFSSGICCENAGSIIDCYYSGRLDGLAGAGICASNSGLISNCHNNAEISCMIGGGICIINSGTIMNCYNVGALIGTSEEIYNSAICTMNNENSVIKNCYYLDSTAETGVSVDNTANSEAIAKSSDEFSNGTVCNLIGYHTYENNFCTLCGWCRDDDNMPPESNDKGYKISSAEDLYWFVNYVNNGHPFANAILMNNIVLNKNVLDENGNLNSDNFMQWNPIGSTLVKYEGTFDGNGHSISGLYFDGNVDEAGLFATIGTNGCVTNLVVLDSYFSGTIVGGISVNNEGTISNSYVTGTLNREKITSAGYICENNSGTISNCYYPYDSIKEISVKNDGAIPKSNLEISNGAVCQLLRFHTYQNGVCALCQKNQGEEPEFPEETIKTVYEISTAEELYRFADYVNQGNYSANAIIVNDIVLNENLVDENGNLNNGSYTKWTPIGSDTHYYEGEFDGQNHTISGLYLVDKFELAGLFGHIGDAGIISNLGIIDSYYNLSYNSSTKISMGSICGQNDGIIANCYNTSNLTGKTVSNIIQIAGICATNNGRIEECYNFGNVYGTINNSLDIASIVSGGICANNENIITSCYNSGDLYLDNNASDMNIAFAGGICGSSLPDGNGTATVENCYNTGNINCESNSYVGVAGICAINYEVCDIVNCYNTGSINGESNGMLYMAGICSDNSGKIKNCYNYGTITALNSNYDALLMDSICGNNIDSNGINNCYYLEGTAEENSSSAIEKTAAQFESGEVAYLLQEGQSDNTDVNICEVWGQSIGSEKYPVLNGDKVYMVEKYSGCGDNAGEMTYAYSNDSTSPVYTHDYSEGGICKVCGHLKNGKDGLKSASLTLTDGVIINYFVILTDEAKSDSNAYIQFTSAKGLNEKIKLSDGVEDNGRYKFSLGLRPDQMADEITAQIVYSNGDLGSSVVYSVKEYADKVNESDNSKALVDAMLTFGAFSQLYTGQNTDNLVTEVSDYTENAVIGEEYKHKIESNISDVLLKSATLQLGADTTIKVKYQLADGANIEDYTFKCDNKVLIPEKSGDYYYVYLRNIPPQELNKMHEFTVSNGIDETVLEYSAFSYMKNILDNADLYNQSIVNLVNSMYYYNEAANAYIK